MMVFTSQMTPTNLLWRRICFYSTLFRRMTSYRTKSYRRRLPNRPHLLICYRFQTSRHLPCRTLYRGRLHLSRWTRRKISCFLFCRRIFPLLLDRLRYVSSMRRRICGCRLHPRRRRRTSTMGASIDRLSPRRHTLWIVCGRLLLLLRRRIASWSVGRLRGRPRLRGDPSWRRNVCCLPRRRRRIGSWAKICDRHLCHRIDLFRRLCRNEKIGDCLFCRHRLHHRNASWENLVCRLHRRIDSWRKIFCPLVDRHRRVDRRHPGFFGGGRLSRRRHPRSAF
mmetsp:Transcript_4726/g.15289  ORF Transcript_4726/g.15289 Transcript_4726/m.15289 type:complete len:280 (+) Transcript_4726:1276-2115(+)